MGGSYFPVVDENHTLAQYDAGGWEPSTASEADIQRDSRLRPLLGVKRTTILLTQ
jgi:hypothetical protein|tara:strand:- start:25 stop:189 length:165 start_codon:yes stop_codon:yes gene_type:complete